MTRAFTPGLQLRECTQITKVRELPVQGEILHKVGERVDAAQIVARAELAGDIQIVRIAEKLGIQPDEVTKGLKVKLGDHIKHGDIICEHVGLFGWFKSRFVSNCHGQVEMISERTGHIGVRQAPKILEVNAYISGEVIALAPGKSITIRAVAAFVQGIFGVGGERNGNLKALQLPANARIEESHIPADAAGAILFGGMAPSAAALKLASARGAVGFVSGSIDDRALASYLGYDLGIALTGDEDISMTVIVTEGFGTLPMSKSSFELLTAQNGKRASINGATQVRAGALRPEIIVTHDDQAQRIDGQSSQAEVSALGVGSAIRIIRFPYFGQIARVLELPKQLQKIETGAYARVLRAELSAGGVVVVPRANVELV